MNVQLDHLPNTSRHYQPLHVLRSYIFHEHKIGLYLNYSQRREKSVGKDESVTNSSKVTY